jgi:hypothetical protein
MLFQGHFYGYGYKTTIPISLCFKTIVDDDGNMVVLNCSPWKDNLMNEKLGDLNIPCLWKTFIRLIKLKNH